MTKSQAYIDESVRNRILQTIEANASATPEEKTDAIMKAILPVVGSAAQRRRSESSMRAAFKEGFVTGQKAGRFAPWHSYIWMYSLIRTKMKMGSIQPGGDEATLRYARFNHD